jgi:hypothetical protein
MLEGVDDDRLRFKTIPDLLFAAQFEVDLFEEGDSSAVSGTAVRKIRSFIRKWSGWVRERE